MSAHRKGALNGETADITVKKTNDGHILSAELARVNTVTFGGKDRRYQQYSKTAVQQLTVYEIVDHDSLLRLGRRVGGHPEILSCGRCRCCRRRIAVGIRVR